MASNVNLTTSNYRTGTNVTIQRKLVDYTISWDDDANVHHTASGTLTFPDVLANASLPNDWLQNHMQDLVIAAGRVILGIDSGV